MAFNRQLIEEYAGGGEKLGLAIRGLTTEDLLCFPVPGTWSIQQIVIHILDSDLIGSDRMKRIIAEDNPSLIGYDETKFAKNLFYEHQSAETAVKIVDLNRRMFAEVLRRLPESAFDRKGQHNEKGEVTLGKQIKGYIDHLDHHLKFIHEKRKIMGKEMW